MSIDIGAKIVGIHERSISYVAGEPPVPQTLYIRDVTLEMIGSPITPAPVFTMAVTDAAQWGQLQVGSVVTVSIIP